MNFLDITKRFMQISIICSNNSYFFYIHQNMDLQYNQADIHNIHDGLWLYK